MTPTDMERLARIETKLDMFLKPAQERLNEHDDRIGSLENWRAWSRGGLAVIGLAISLLVSRVLFFK